MSKDSDLQNQAYKARIRLGLNEGDGFDKVLEQAAKKLLDYEKDNDVESIARLNKDIRTIVIADGPELVEKGKKLAEANARAKIFAENRSEKDVPYNFKLLQLATYTFSTSEEYQKNDLQKEYLGKLNNNAKVPNDLYEILGVNQKSSPTEIKKSHQLRKETLENILPQIQKDSPEHKALNSELVAVEEANKILANPKSKAKYDKYLDKLESHNKDKGTKLTVDSSFNFLPKSLKQGVLSIKDKVKDTGIKLSEEAGKVFGSGVKPKDTGRHR